MTALLTKQQLAKIPPLYSQEEIEDPIVYITIRCQSAFWLITEANNEGLALGWGESSGHEMGELGYISLDEINKLKRNYYVEVKEVEKPLSVVKEEFYK